MDRETGENLVGDDYYARAAVAALAMNANATPAAAAATTATTILAITSVGRPIRSISTSAAAAIRSATWWTVAFVTAAAAATTTVCHGDPRDIARIPNPADRRGRFLYIATKCATVAARTASTATTTR